jgi:hypothetical protein
MRNNLTDSDRHLILILSSQGVVNATSGRCQKSCWFFSEFACAPACIPQSDREREAAKAAKIGLRTQTLKQLVAERRILAIIYGLSCWRRKLTPCFAENAKSTIGENGMPREDDVAVLNATATLPPTGSLVQTFLLFGVLELCDNSCSYKWRRYHSE